MSASSPSPRDRTSDGLDISTPRSHRRKNSIILVVLWVITFALFLLLSNFGLSTFWAMMVLLSLFVFWFVGQIGWFLLVRRGVLSWLRLATKPAKVMAQGRPELAERAFQRALARARRYPPLDRRRGVMLCALAEYSANQGRVQEARELFEECVDTLARYARTDPMDYFVALNNYAILFIHLHDYGAAQRILERVIDLIPAVKSRQDSSKLIRVSQQQIQDVELTLLYNLANVFIEMNELAEASHPLHDADVLLNSRKRRQGVYFDHFHTLRAQWFLVSGELAQAWDECAHMTDPNYRGALRVRARLHLAQQEFLPAEELLRKVQIVERKKGSLHRPGLFGITLELAESLFGQGKNQEAFVVFQEARSMVQDFALPHDASWRRQLQTWLKRAQEAGQSELAAALAAEIQSTPEIAQQSITILDKFRFHPPPPG